MLGSGSTFLEGALGVGLVGALASSLVLCLAASAANAGPMFAANTLNIVPCAKLPFGRFGLAKLATFTAAPWAGSDVGFKKATRITRRGVR